MILLREIIVSGLREYLAGLQVSVPVSALAKWKTTAQLVALGALILGGALPEMPWVHDFGIACLWIAAALTLISGYDYLQDRPQAHGLDGPNGCNRFSDYL